MFYVYCLIDPSDDRIFYVGKGSGKRMYVHEQKVKQNKASNNNWNLFRRIKKILDSGDNVKYLIIANDLTQDEALQLEAEKIKELGIENLCNLNYGGSGRPPGYKHSQETRQKIRESNTGKKLSQKTCQLIGESKRGNKNMLGKTHTPDTKKKISDSWKNRDLKNYSIAQSRRRKKVIQLSLSGEVVKVWESITSAVKHNGKSVCDALYGRQKIAHGYVWKIQEDTI